MGDTRSEEFPIKRGVPQISKLGPTLYSIYKKDFGIEYNEEQGMAKYADDLLYWCSGKYKPRIVKNVKNGFQKIEEEMEKWGSQNKRDGDPILHKECKKMARVIKTNPLSLDRGAPI